jgi:hypothetical protein
MVSPAEHRLIVQTIQSEHMLSCNNVSNHETSEEISFPKQMVESGPDAALTVQGGASIVAPAPVDKHGKKIGIPIVSSYLDQYWCSHSIDGAFKNAGRSLQAIRM